MAVKIAKDMELKLIESIKRYFLENHDDEIGELKASLFLDFCLREIGPVIYNQAIMDAQTFMQDKITDLDSSCYEPEFGYWQIKK